MLGGVARIILKGGIRFSKMSRAMPNILKPLFHPYNTKNLYVEWVIKNYIGLFLLIA